ncbi:MAG: VWA domain-containing protein [Myxococcales bacterium]|nr:VWA domain-containing protein [Myxococcales bacterium]HIK84939.1 VWA domain-containing protein [Myxococcales bacterium]
MFELRNFEFSDPLLMLFGLFAPLVFVQARRLPSVIRYSSLQLVTVRKTSIRIRLAWLPAALLAVATLALSLALAGPRTGNAVSEVKREGIAIAMVVDRSGSMQARDFVRGDTSTSRLDVVKRIFHDFVTGEGGMGGGRPDDLIGLVSFARYADGLCPLTLDHGSLLAILDQLETPTDQREDGTAVGEGLSLAVERLRRQEATSKIVILLTDGVSNAGEIEPLQAADLAAQYGIKVYTIGAGYTGYAPFPVQRADGRTSLRRVPVEIDETTLQRIAQRSGGRYFHATDEDGLREVIEEIGRLERSEVSEVRYLEYEAHFAPFVSVALLSVALAALLSSTWLRRLPS